MKPNNAIFLLSYSTTLSHHSDLSFVLIARLFGTADFTKNPSIKCSLGFISKWNLNPDLYQKSN